MGGSRKKDVCYQIVDMINHASMRKIYTGKQVQLKIEHLEKSFEEAYEFLLQKQVRGSWNRVRVHSVTEFQLERIVSIPNPNGYLPPLTKLAAQTEFSQLEKDCSGSSKDGHGLKFER